MHITSALLPGAKVNASIVNGGGRPAILTFNAPDAVARIFEVTFELDFGSGLPGAPTKNIAGTVQVEP